LINIRIENVGNIYNIYNDSGSRSPRKSNWDEDHASH
jgi:hypothetical protein